MKQQLHECCLEEQIQTALPAAETLQVFKNYGFSVSGNESKFIAKGKVLNKAVVISAEAINGGFRIMVGSQTLALSQIVNDVVGYLLANTF